MNTNDIDVVVTDFGAVRLSQKTLGWLGSLAPDWRELAAKKRPSKRALMVKEAVRRLEVAVSVAAAIAWHGGGVLEEF